MAVRCTMLGGHTVSAPPVFSVKQPWAGLLVTKVKRFENRTWRPVDLGWFLVHASSGRAPGLPALAADASYRKAIVAAGMQDPKTWPTSAVVGAVKIGRVWDPDQLRPKLSKMDLFLCGDVEGTYLWEITAAVEFTNPLPCKGKLNLWYLAGDVLAEYEGRFAANAL